MILDVRYINEKYKDLKQVKVQGWVKNYRSSGSIAFIVLNDGTSFNGVQVVVKQDLSNFSLSSNLKLYTAIEVTGDIVITEKAKQPFEIVASSIVVLKECVDSYPMQKKEQSMEFLRENSDLRPRTNTFNAVFRIRSELSFAIHDFFRLNNYLYVHTPILTSNDAEGAGEAFSVTTSNPKENFFGSPASLTVSGQLNAEAFAQSYKKVYTFGPTFRAEKSHTNRHVSEFWMIEPETAFADLSYNIDLIEKFVKHVIAYVIKTCAVEINFLSTVNKQDLTTKLNQVVSNPFVKIMYKQAIEIINEAIKKGKKFENNDVFFGIDLASEHERYIAEEHFKSPVFLTHYPKEIKAFYMKLSEDNRTVEACDLLLPGIGEVVGGSQREDDYNKLINRVRDMKVNQQELKWYIDLRSYGYYKSAGFGLGFERLLMYITGIENIRDVIPFPRSHGNIKF
jgi:asparaginyl-tRNA synthetase